MVKKQMVLKTFTIILIIINYGIDYENPHLYTSSSILIRNFYGCLLRFEKSIINYIYYQVRLNNVINDINNI